MFGVRGAIVALLLAVLVAESASSAARRLPRFTVTIQGTQRFEWAFTGNLLGSGCRITKGEGVQVLRFATPRPVRVVATNQPAPPGTPGGFEFRLVGTGKRVIPLKGTETREYRADPAARADGCAEPERARPYAQSCHSTNPFVAGAGVVLVRGKTTLAMHTPTNAVLYDRFPKTCNAGLFDVRNTTISQLISWGTRTRVRGGSITGRGNRLTSTGKISGCVDPSESAAFGASFDLCRNVRPPARGAAFAVTGTISASWTIVLKRLR
jgi:hypothetical protein